MQHKLSFSWRNQQLLSSSLNHHGVFAYPTEAVYGLGCDPWDEIAVARLLSIKQRSWEKGLILVAGHIDQLDFLLESLSLDEQAKLKKSWPGPTTWLIPHQDRLPIWLTGKHDTIAVRVSAHPTVQALCAAAKQPLISTSANVSGQPPAKNALQIRKQFGAQISGIISGSLGGLAKPTEIKELRSGKIIRASI